MKLLIQSSRDPYYNIATEEYLMKNGGDDFIILYRNTPSVIVGKHQNTMAELNHVFIANNQIPVIRRLSGGGTVFHDLGNVNFCFILNGREGSLVDFRRFTEPIVLFLQILGIDAYRGEKNDIRVGEFKVSGNAEHVFKNRVMHHGTLLFNSNLQWLEQAIRSNEECYSDRAIRSNRSKTINIANLLPYRLTVEEFENKLVEYLKEFFGATFIQLDPKTVQVIDVLANTKYKDWEWNYGYNANYEFKVNFGSYTTTLTIRNGIIESVELSGNNPDLELINLLKGKKHDYCSLKEELYKSDNLKRADQLIKKLF